MADPRDDRRRWLLGVASAAVVGCSKHGCSRAAPEDLPKVDTSEVELHELDFDRNRGGPQKASVLVPRWGPPGTKYPLLIALHGRGEANRGLEVGAWGWIRDYWLDRTAIRLRHPPLNHQDLLGLSNTRYLDRLNKRIQTPPFEGLVVVCPHTPDILATDDLDAAAPFAAFLVEHLLEEVRRRFPVIPTREATGIDGVSLGGRMALLAATEQPAAFGVVGTLQAAFRVGEVGAVASRVADAWGSDPHPGALRILTSDDDPFRPTLHKLTVALGGSGIPVRYDVVPGPHDYDFNRGPGGFDMLSWHDGALRGRGLLDAG